MNAVQKTAQWALRPLVLASLLLSTAALAQPGETLNQPVAKGAYELAFSGSDNALFLATSQSRSLDKGGVVYRLDPQTLAITQIIHNDLKPFGAAINPQTNTLYVGNSVEGAVTAIDASSGEVRGRLVLDARKRSKEVKPLQPRELVVDAATNRVYISGVGAPSVVWVVDGKTMQLLSTVPDTGKGGTGLALDAAAQKLYVTNGEGELITVNTRTNAVEKRQKLEEGQEHFFLNISLDTATHRAFITDSKQAAVLVVDTRSGKVVHKIAVPESLAVLFNPQRQELYVTHRKAGTVSIINARNYNVLQTITAPGMPNSLALSADGQALYVSVKQASSPKKEATAPDSVMRIALK
ncbi:putative protein YncE [Duffyella gerundensis]|uniref:YNCE-like beta-propeller domain-containing protein n=1 Tax=Duffyella gerundensis TaxID=1619313 RepID=A0A0U5L8D1_9GAMM|nr:YncE family protein [Duffyella gerundensis]CUU25387.1 putative protein YncE [Duffyella gerundensis]